MTHTKNEINPQKKESNDVSSCTSYIIDPKYNKVKIENNTIIFSYDEEKKHEIKSSKSTENSDCFITKNNTLNNTFISQNPKVLHLKKLAKKLYKENKDNALEKFPLTYFHDVIAKQYGYKHWHEFHTNIKSLYQQKENLNYMFSANLDIPIDMPKQSHPIHIGYERATYMNLWLNDDLLKTHTTIIGNQIERDTILKNMAKQKIKHNIHMVFITSDINKTDELIAYAKNHGREKDIRRLTFFRENNFNSLDNTEINNIHYFSFLNHFNINNFRYLFSSFYNDSFMWNFHNSNDTKNSQHNVIVKNKNLLIEMLSLLLSHKYSYKDNILTIDKIRDEASLTTLFNYYINKIYTSGSHTFPQLQDAIEQYLVSLPGFNPQLPFENQPDSVFENHGYISISLLQRLDYLEHNFKYYYYGEEIFDFKDINGNNKNLLYFIELPNDSSPGFYFACFSSLIMNIINKNIFDKELFHGLGNFINDSIKKGNFQESHRQTIEPLHLKTIFIDDCPLSPAIFDILAKATNSNQQFIFSYPDFNSDENINDAIKYVGSYITGKSYLDKYDNSQPNVVSTNDKIYFSYQNQNSYYYLDLTNETLEPN